MLIAITIANARHVLTTISRFCITTALYGIVLALRIFWLLYNARSK